MNTSNLKNSIRQKEALGTQGAILGGLSLEAQREMLAQMQAEAKELEKQSRECPVPKPKGWFGEMLGFAPTTGKVEAQRESAGGPDM